MHDLGEEADLDETLAAALSQIDQKEYAADLIAKGMPESRIRKYGFAFEVYLDGLFPESKKLNVARATLFI